MTPVRLVIVFTALLALLPAVAGPYATRLAVIGLLYVAGATAWDLVGGLTGQVSFGHAAFFGVGAYVTAILTREGVPMPITILPAALAAAAYGAIWGWPCLRLRGPFFAIATIGVGEATRLAALLAEPVTGGATGLTLPIGGSAALLPFYLALGLAAVSIITATAVRGSKLGLGLACIREDVDAAESIGIRTGWVQVQALMISAAIVGAAGSIYARYLFYVEPGDVFAFNRSIGLILMAIIGGVNSLWGPPLGAVLFLALEQVLAAYFPTAHLGIYGLLLILMMLFEPRGLWAVASSVFGLRSLVSGESLVSGRSAVSGSPGAAVALAVESVTKRYGGLTAVDDVSATFAPGSITAIIGPNGAGKTTLFSIIAGAVLPTRGRVRLGDEDITSHRADAVCRVGIGRTFQVVRPFWHLTVRDHVRAAALYGRDGRHANGRGVEDVLTTTGLSGVADAPANALTLADCRRLEIARALATGARTILLDETMAGLTPEETREAIALVQRVNASGVTVILIEHVLPAVTGLASRAIVLDRGRVIADGPPRDVLASPAVKKAYLGED